jgi:hypothetical protein
MPRKKAPFTKARAVKQQQGARALTVLRLSPTTPGRFGRSFGKVSKQDTGRFHGPGRRPKTGGAAFNRKHPRNAKGKFRKK